MNLYSYCLKIDDGAAPNPFYGVCTLVICKPAIRRTAQVGDWIVGLGSANSPIGDIYDKIVYMMKITQKMTMSEYDKYCPVHLPGKIPKWTSADYRERAGDCIYDFRTVPPTVRNSVHSEKNRKKDLGGENALLSDRFYYFGDKPIPLPDYLMPLIHSTQGHRVKTNEPYVAKFVSWVESLKLNRNVLYGEPQGKDYLLTNPEKLICFRDEDEDGGEIC